MMVLAASPCVIEAHIADMGASGCLALGQRGRPERLKG
jgi:hypothetical protein